MATSTVVGHSSRLVCTCNHCGDMKAQLMEEIVPPCVRRSFRKPDSVLTISHPVIVRGKIEGFSKRLQPLLSFCNSNPLSASKFARVFNLSLQLPAFSLFVFHTLWSTPVTNLFHPEYDRWQNFKQTLCVHAIFKQAAKKKKNLKDNSGCGVTIGMCNGHTVATPWTARLRYFAIFHWRKAWWLGRSGCCCCKSKLRNRQQKDTSSLLFVADKGILKPIFSFCKEPCSKCLIKGFCSSLLL